MAVLILTGGMLLIGIPLACLVRHKPEPYGYKPDGDVDNATVVPKSMATPQPIQEEA